MACDSSLSSPKLPGTLALETLFDFGLTPDVDNGESGCPGAAPEESFHLPLSPETQSCRKTRGHRVGQLLGSWNLESVHRGIKIPFMRTGLQLPFPSQLQPSPAPACWSWGRALGTGMARRKHAGPGPALSPLQLCFVTLHYIAGLFPAAE